MTSHHSHQARHTTNDSFVLGVASLYAVFYKAMIIQYANDFSEFERLHISYAGRG